MLKATKKLSQKDLVLKRNITTRHVYDNMSIRGQSRKDILDTQASVRHHVGFLRLNREHRHNLLTHTYLKSIRRSLETLNQDEVVKVIYMTGEKGEHFSNGTDFRTLLHYKKEGNDQKIAAYLEELYGLQIQAAKINKPLIGVAPGHSYNSGASFLQATAMPTVTLDSKMSFNEASFGFVPHGGSSYYLSRLPGEIGTFLALTGLPITGIDAKEFGLADELVHYSAAYEEEICDILFAMEFPIPSGELLSNRGKFNPWKQQITDRMASDEKHARANEYEMTRAKHENIIHEEFFEPKDKVPSLTAHSDFKYKQMLERYNLKFAEAANPGYLESAQAVEGVYQNYFNYVMGYVKSHSGHDYPRDPRTILLKNAGVINRCFYPSTLEEIVENLKREEGSPFAKLCLDRINTNSTLSMKLSLKMLREARNLDFKGAIQQELNVALNKIQDSDFDLGITEVLMKPATAQANPGFSKNVSADQVQGYFSPNKWMKEVQLDVVEKAMLPTRFFYEKYSDQVRLWVNEDSTHQPEVREHFEAELKEALRDQGIDLRDRALTIASAREKLYTQELMERRQKLFDERLEHILSDDKMREGYFQQAREHVDHLDKSGADNFNKLVNSQVQQIFEQAYLEKLQRIFTSSQEAHGLEKRRMLIRFKKFLFQSRILTYAHEEVDRMVAILQNMPFKEPHMKEQWDGKLTGREVEHPDLKNSFLWHMSKAVGRVNLTPPELAKEYLTNPDAAKNLQLYSFDKKELLKLREDLLANPEKYEKALRTEKKQAKMGDKLTMKQKKKEEYDYWYRVLHEGVLPQDSLPYYKQLLAYRDFVEGIEYKAFDTLKLTVQRLLNDFEGQDVIEYSQKDKETKVQALRRLISIVNDVEPTSAASTGSKDKQFHLTQSARSTKDIKKFINKLLDQDREIKQLIPAEVEGNQLVSKFREEILAELYQLIEFVLINSADKNRASLPAKHLLQERLASLANPNNTQQRNVTHLRVLDSFLNEKNSEALIKDAIKIAKPYFFAQVLAPRLEQESRKVFDSLKAEVVGNDVLLYYALNHQYPEMRSSQIMQRMASFHVQKDKEAYMNQIFPDQSFQYQMKRYISLMGMNTGSTVAELEAATKQEYDNLQKSQDIRNQADDKMTKDILSQRDKAFRKPFDRNNPDKEIDQHHMFNAYNYDNAELEQIMKYTERAENLRDYIELNEQEIRQQLSNPSDWLHIFSSAINNYDLNITSVFRQNLQHKQEGDYQEAYLQEMQNIFGGSRQLTWGSVGEYAKFLNELHETGNKTFSDKDVQADYQQVSDYIVRQLDTVDGEELLRSQSLYEMIKHTKHQINRVNDKKTSIRDDVKDFAKLQHRILNEKHSREAVESLLKQAPRDIQQLVSQSLLPATSQYLNWAELERVLHTQDYEKLRNNLSATIIDKERVFADLRKASGSKSLQAFLNNYLNTRLDVVSISESREIVANAPTSNVFDERLQTQIKTVLDFAEDSLKFVPHSRREAMTLGDYLQRHSYIANSASSGEQYMTDILKNKIHEVLGQTLDVGAADMIDWEFAGIRTNPAVHAQEDARVKTALAEGKGVQPEAITEYTIESHLSGRAAQELGEAALIGYINPATGAYQVADKTKYEMEHVLRDAKKLTELRPESVYTKTYFENKLLSLYSAAEFNQKAVEKIIQQYTELRLKECLLNADFNKKVKQGQNGHIYVKMLKEQIADELSISRPAKPTDFTFDKLIQDPSLKVDVEGRYNLSDMSNQQSIGLDKLIDPQAEQNTLDKLLGDYFLQKRGQYVANNKLLDQLNEQFGEKTRKFADGHISKVNDSEQVNHDAYPFAGSPGIAFAHLKQDLKKDLHPRVANQDFNDMLELDIASAQALQNGKNGLGGSLREDFSEDMTRIPEYFNMFDVRKPAGQYVEDKLASLLQSVFEVRRKVEKSLSRNELIAYDRVLASHLTKDSLIPKLRSACEADRNQLIQLKQAADMKNEGVEDFEIQFLKTDNNQGEINKDVKNQDALYKFLAYSGMLEKQRREDIDKTRKNNQLIFGIQNFEEFYKGELQRDVKQEPRQVNPEEYMPKRGAVEADKAGEGFKTRGEREADYFREFELYKENKKEQLERNQLFFVLEQFFAHSKTNPDPLNKAQEAIVDYFKDTENTFFFDKNKIQ